MSAAGAGRIVDKLLARFGLRRDVRFIRLRRARALGLTAVLFQGVVWAAGWMPVQGWAQPRDVEQMAAIVVERMLETDLDAQGLNDAELKDLLEEVKLRLRQPADPNTAGRGRLSGIPFLTPSHVEAVLNHRRRSGRRIVSWEELAAIEGFEPDNAEFVRWFFHFPPPRSKEPAGRERTRNPLRDVQVRWSGAAGRTVQRIEGERRRPEDGGYLGDPWRAEHRMEIESRNWEVSWMGWKHTGEPVAELRSVHRNSVYAHVRHPERELEIQAGDIRVGPGSGMVLGTGASSGSSFARLGSAGGHRRALGTDPGTRLRGVAVGAGRGERIRMDLHLSRQLRPATDSGTDALNRPRAGRRFATLAELESATTLQEHRAGLRVQTGREAWGGGFSIAGTAFDRTVKVYEDLFGRAVVLPAGRWQVDIGADGVWHWRPRMPRGLLAGGWIGAQAGWTAGQPLRTDSPDSLDAWTARPTVPRGRLPGAFSAGGGVGFTDGGTLSASWHMRTDGFEPLQGRAPGRFHTAGRETSVTFRFSSPIGERRGGGVRWQSAMHAAPDPTPRARRSLGLWEVEAAAWRTFQGRVRAEISLSHRARDGASNGSDWLGRPMERLEQTRRSAITATLEMTPAAGDGAVRLRTRLGAIRSSARLGDPTGGRPPGTHRPARIEDPLPRWGAALTQDLEWRISGWLGVEGRWSWHAGRDAQTAHRIGRLSMPSSVSSVYLGGDGSFRSVLIRLEPRLRSGRLVVWLRYDAHHLAGAFTNGSGLDLAQGPLRQTLRIQIQGSRFGE